MTDTEILKELERLVAELSDTEDRVKLTMESDLVADAGLDSIDLIDLLCGMGERYGLDLSVDDLEELAEPTRVSCLVQYIGRRFHEAKSKLVNSLGASAAPMASDTETN